MQQKKQTSNYSIGLFAPADCVNPETFNNSLTLIKKKLKNCEFIIPQNILKKHGLFAGADKERIADINQLIASKPDMLLAVKGGYGSSRLLTKIDFKNIKKNKIKIMGYSDLTALLLTSYAKTGIPVFYGYMPTADFKNNISSKQFQLFNNTLSNKDFEYPFNWNFIKKNDAANSVISAISLAGCLSILPTLAGIESFKIFNINNVLFIEDINEEPYKIDRMLTHLRDAGAFRNTKCLFIDFNKCNPSEKNKDTISIKKSLLEIFEDYNFPIINFPRFGHRENRIIIPVGYNCKIDFNKRKIVFSIN